MTAKAQSAVLVLEWEQHWPTYGVGGTRNFGTGNFFVGDIDNDGTVELITGGLTYDKPNYSEDELQAPLRIWNWNGENFTLEASSSWAGLLVAQERREKRSNNRRKNQTAKNANETRS